MDIQKGKNIANHWLMAIDHNTGRSKTASKNASQLKEEVMPPESTQTNEQ